MLINLQRYIINWYIVTTKILLAQSRRALHRQASKIGGIWKLRLNYENY